MTCLGFAEDVDFNLPASLVPGDWADLDEWARGGPASFVHSLLSSVLLDIAWHHTVVQTSLDKRWRKWSAAYRLDDITKTESYLAQVSIQRSAANGEKQWFPDEGRSRVLWRLTGLSRSPLSASTLCASKLGTRFSSTRSRRAAILQLPRRELHDPAKLKLNPENDSRAG